MSDSDHQAGTPSKLHAFKSGLLIRASAFKDFSNTAIPRQNHLKFLGVAGLVALAGLFALPNNEVATVQAAETVKLPTPNIDLTRYDLALDESFAIAPVDQTTLTVKSGDSLGPLLQKNGLSGTEAYRVTQAFAEVFPPRKVRVGQKFDLYFQDGELQNLTFRPTVEKPFSWIVATTISAPAKSQPNSSMRQSVSKRVLKIRSMSTQRVLVRQTKLSRNLPIFTNIPSTSNATFSRAMNLNCSSKLRAIIRARSSRRAICSTHLFAARQNDGLLAVLRL